MVEMQLISSPSNISSTSDNNTNSTTPSSDHSTSSPLPHSLSLLLYPPTFSPPFYYYYYYYLPSFYVYPPQTTTFSLPPPSPPPYCGDSDVLLIQAPPPASTYRKKLQWKPNDKNKSKKSRNKNTTVEKSGHASGTGSGSKSGSQPGLLPLSPLSGHLGDNCTSVMIKNIPNSLSRKTLISMLDSHCREQNRGKNPYTSQYDFVYLPFDFEYDQNFGYAFVNFTNAEAATKLRTCWNGKGWEGCFKIREITKAKFQGIEKFKAHFQCSVFRCHSPEYLPVEFSPPRDGFNGQSCKVFNIGKWFPPMAKSWNASTVVPPRLGH